MKTPRGTWRRVAWSGCLLAVAVAWPACDGPGRYMENLEAGAERCAAFERFGVRAEPCWGILREQALEALLPWGRPLQPPFGRAPERCADGSVGAPCLDRPPGGLWRRTLKAEGDPGDPGR